MKIKNTFFRRRDAFTKSAIFKKLSASAFINLLIYLHKTVTISKYLNIYNFQYKN